jgi:AraC-like DNA-binding protein
MNKQSKKVFIKNKDFEVSMKLIQINPYVRFARVQKTVSRRPIVGVDHRLFWCVHGEGEITVQGQAYPMTPSTFLFVQSGTPYQNTSETDDMVLLAYNFDLFYNQENAGEPISFVSAGIYCPDMLIEQDIDKKLNGLPTVIYLQNFYKKETFQDIIDEYNRKDIYYNERCGALLKDLLICAMRASCEEKTALQKNQGETILSYVRENFDKPINNASVAKYFSYHENYLNQILKEQTGYTLHRYLLEYRITMASSLLRSGEYTVSEVAEKVGFSNIFAFSKSFKKFTGKSPTAWLPK